MRSPRRAVRGLARGPVWPSKGARCTGLSQRIRPYAMFSKLAVVLDEAKHFWRNGDSPDERNRFDNAMTFTRHSRDIPAEAIS